MSKKFKLNPKQDSGLFARSFWLGSDHSAVNINRFWLYLGGISLTLCAICLVRVLEVSSRH
jgi:hypothetical protein